MNSQRNRRKVWEEINRDINLNSYPSITPRPYFFLFLSLLSNHRNFLLATPHFLLIFLTQWCQHHTPPLSPLQLDLIILLSVKRLKATRESPGGDLSPVINSVSQVFVRLPLITFLKPYHIRSVQQNEKKKSIQTISQWWM